jgi:hypothetical protein
LPDGQKQNIEKFTYLVLSPVGWAGMGRGEMTQGKVHWQSFKKCFVIFLILVLVHLYQRLIAKIEKTNI